MEVENNNCNSDDSGIIVKRVNTLPISPIRPVVYNNNIYNP